MMFDLVIHIFHESNLAFVGERRDIVIKIQIISHGELACLQARMEFFDS